MDSTNFGNLLKIAREKRGWDQPALAIAVEMSQQTVSRWERGLSRPQEEVVRRLAELFETDTDDWLMHAGYMIEQPVRPLVPVLPLDKLTEEMFELFCRDFIQKLHPQADVHRYGQRGHKQYGIDLIARETTAKTDYQCKRHQQFGPEKVRTAVKDTSTAADHHYLLLSRPATPDARDAIDEYGNWSLWDVEDISAKVRYLPVEDRLDLIDTYFPGWRSHFLGIDTPSPWLTPDKYFRPLNNKRQVFSHGWNFFGRHEELKRLTAFVADKAVAATVLSGIGGVGKTRLLKEMANAVDPGMKVVFMTQRAEPTAADLEKLPKTGVLVIDDAHEYSDLQALLSGIAVVRPYLKILISTRPYGVTMLEDQLLQAGLAFKHEGMVTLGKMVLADAEKLALEILRGNGGDEEQAHRIAEITLDCPLATVIGARLVADGEIKPEVMANSDNFRRHLLRRFRDIISGKIGGVKNADAITALMDLIAVVQPIDPEANFEEVALKILDRPYDNTVRDMRALEDAGVLIRRKNRLRIAPDLLADFIRADAAYNANSKSPTGYVDRVFKATKNELATNLLSNLSQLDWRLSADGTQAALLDAIWRDLEKQFLAGDIGMREEMLKALEKVAYYQPEQAIKFARLAIDNPTDKVKKTKYDHLLGGKRTYGTVLAQVPPILKYAAYNGEFVLDALDILRQMAKTDNRDPGRTTDHPVSIMRYIAGIQPGKPMGYIETVNNHILGWLDDGTEGFSPFDVLDGALATAGHHTEFKGITLTMTPFKVNAEAMSNTRNKVVDAALHAIQTAPLPNAVRAMKTIEEALRGPFGNDVTHEDRARWEPGQLALLERLKDVMANANLDPFIAVEARRAVNWHATYSKGATKPLANAVLKAIPKTLDHKLSRALADGWGWSFERSQTDFQRDEAAFVEWRKRTAQELLEEYAGRFDQLINLLEVRITALDKLERPAGGNSGPFIYTLVSESNEFAKQLGEYILANPQSELSGTIGVVINATAATDYPAAVTLASDALKTGDLYLQRSVASSLGWGMHTNPVGPDELPLIAQLATSKDAITRQNLVRAAQRFPEDQKQTALDIFMGMTIGDDAHLVGELLGEFDETHGAFRVEQLTPDHLERLQDQLVELDEISEYQIAEFAGEVSLLQPEWVLQLLFRRVDSKRNIETDFKYHPVPLSWESRHGLRINETSAYEKCLQAVRNWTNAERDNWHRHHYGPEIFKAVSAGYDDVTMRVISEWIVSSDPQQVQTAANLLSEFPSSFLWNHSDLVVDLLERADKLGEECYRRVSSSLHSAAIQGSRTGTPGQPFQEDIDQRDQSAAMLKKLPPNSPAVKFYKSLHSIATEAIKRDDIDEEDLFDN